MKQIITSVFGTGFIGAAIKTITGARDSRIRMESDIANIKQDITDHERRDDMRHRELLDRIGKFEENVFNALVKNN